MDVIGHIKYLLKKSPTTIDFCYIKVILNFFIHSLS